MMNIGNKPILTDLGVVTSLAWKIGGKVNYVLEGNINYTGAVITWMKDQVKLIDNPGETEALALAAYRYMGMFYRYGGVPIVTKSFLSTDDLSAPRATVQEMVDFVALGWDLAFKYRAVSMILADGVIGQMMEKVVLPEQRPRHTEEWIRENCPWAVNGRKGMRPKNIITSLELDDDKMEENNHRFQATYREIEKNEQRCELINTDDCDYLIVAFGSMARISQKAMELAAEEGIKVGIARPITLWPFPVDAIRKAAEGVKGILSVELSAGQMIEDIKLATECNYPVDLFCRLGGNVPAPDEILNALKEKLVKKLG